MKRYALLALVAAVGLLIVGDACATPRATELMWRDGNLVIQDADLSPANSLWDDCPLDAIRRDPTVGSIWYNDFRHYTTSEDGLTSVITNSGTAAVGVVDGGVLAIDCSDGTIVDNDESYVGGKTVTYNLATGKDLWFEARVKFTETATDDDNIIVGLGSTHAANTLLDDGGGPEAGGNKIVLFKVDGGTVWQGETSYGAGNITTLTSLATRQSGSWQRLGFRVSGTSSVTFYIDGSAVGTITTNLPNDNHTVIFGGKNGSAEHEVTLYVDWFKIVHLR